MAILCTGGATHELENAEKAAVRFMEAVIELRIRLAKDERARNYGDVTGIKESAAVRRASLDLTRALADLRRTR